MNEFERLLKGYAHMRVSDEMNVALTSAAEYGLARVTMEYFASREEVPSEAEVEEFIRNIILLTGYQP